MIVKFNEILGILNEKLDSVSSNLLLAAKAETKRIIKKYNISNKLINSMAKEVAKKNQVDKDKLEFIGLADYGIIENGLVQFAFNITDTNHPKFKSTVAINKNVLK